MTAICCTPWPSPAWSWARRFQIRGLTSQEPTEQGWSSSYTCGSCGLLSRKTWLVCGPAAGQRQGWEAPESPTMGNGERSFQRWPESRLGHCRARLALTAPSSLWSLCGTRGGSRRQINAFRRGKIPCPGLEHGRCMRRINALSGMCCVGSVGP